MTTKRTKRVSPVDGPNRQLKAVLRAEERLIDAALRLARHLDAEDKARAFGIFESWTQDQFRRAARALTKARATKTKRAPRLAKGGKR